MSSAAQVSQLRLATDRRTDARNNEAQAFQQRLSLHHQNMGDLQRLARTVELAFQNLAAPALDAQRTLDDVQQLIARLWHDSPWNDLQHLLDCPLDDSIMLAVNGCIGTAMLITSYAVNLLKVKVLQENGQDLYQHISGTIVAALGSALRDFDEAIRLVNVLVAAWTVTPQAKRRSDLNDIMIRLDLAIGMMHSCEADCDKLLSSKRKDALKQCIRWSATMLVLWLGAAFLAPRVPIPIVNKGAGAIGLAGGVAAFGGSGLLGFATYKSLEDIGKIREHLKPSMASMKQLEDTAAILKQDLAKLVSEIQAATRNN